MFVRSLRQAAALSTLSLALWSSTLPSAAAQERTAVGAPADVTPAPSGAAVVPAPAAPSVAPAAAPAWTPVITGSFFTRYELRSGYDDLGVSTASSRPRLLEGDAFFYRARLGIGTGLLPLGRLKVALQFTPQTAGTFGVLSATPNAPSTVVDANLGLHEGYGRVQGDYVRVDSGRFEMNYGDSVMIGNLDWNEIGRTFDGVRARASASPTSAWVDLFVTLLDEGRPDIVRGQTLDSRPGIGLGDLYFAGVYGALGPLLGHGLDLDAYALARVWGEAKNVRVNAASPIFQREQASDATFGLRAKQRIGAFDYRFEGGIQRGSRPGVAPTANTVNPARVVENVEARAYHADLEVGASFAEDKLRLGLEGIYASGDDANSTGRNEGWDELYPTAHRTLGLSDAFVQNGQKRTNVGSGLVHVTITPFKALCIQLDGLVFARPERARQYDDQRGLAGGEVDLGAAYTLAKGLRLRSTYGVFVPTEKMYTDVLPQPSPGNYVDPVHFYELELRWTIE